MLLMRRKNLAAATPQEAIAYLASACDGAIRADGHGFAAHHVDMGHALAARRRWRPRHRRQALTLIRYYRAQLERAGFDVGALLGHRTSGRRSRRASTGTPACWAPDPTGISRTRFWNGARWTSRTA